MLAITAIGETFAMTQEAVNIYVTLTAQVIRELALLGALLCLLALIPALLLRGGRADPLPRRDLAAADLKEADHERA